MRAFHDSRNIDYRSPYGVVEPGVAVTLSLDVQDAPHARVELRTWIEGVGEKRIDMTDVGQPSEDGVQAGVVRYQTTLCPDAPGIVWYHFIITDAHGTQKRYGAREGARGGEGQIFDWEPPSFQLTVCDARAGETQKQAELRALERPFWDVATAFFCGETSAPAFVEAVEALRENCPADVYRKAIDLVSDPRRVKLLARFGGVDFEDAEDDDLRAGDVLEGGQFGLAKGRLWCASIVQLMAFGIAPHSDGDADGADCANPYDRLAEVWADEDGDCGAILRNAADLRLSLPLFEQDEPSLFAVNDDVVGFWRHADDGTSACVLVNASLQHAYDIAVPMVNEGVSETIAGYGVPIVDAGEARDVPDVFAGAERYAMIHLYQLGSAIAYFHDGDRLARPLEPGMGVLAHITSLPSESSASGSGTIGCARAFVDWLADAGVRYWQILPVNPTDDHGSPYAGISAFAGNVRLADGFPDFDDYTIDLDEYKEFCEKEADWLEPYASFMAIREKVGAGIAWQDWPKKYRRFNARTIASDPKLKASAEAYRRGQFIFERQWKDVRAYANARGVQIVGDMPIYVSADSADVWAHPGLFQLGADGEPAVVAGCPPDAFAVEGQVWGNPVYDWDACAADGYAWWLRRLERAFELYDVVRLDHFIGFARYFSIPEGEKATAGAYRLGPGMALFEAAREKFGPLPVIAEDLGSITPSVRLLVAACGFPGMDIVQFVDGGDPLSGYQPRPEKIAYTGTHDNQTIVGYCETRYPDFDAVESSDELIRKVLACDAPVCVLPLQDVLGLADEARMNVPGTVEGNWEWQAKAADIEAAHSRMKELVDWYDEAHLE